VWGWESSDIEDSFSFFVVPPGGSKWVCWGGVFSWEENVNLPLTRIEQAGQFYAQNRLGVTIWGAHVWDEETGSMGEFFTIASRVLEKSGIMAMALITEAVGRYRKPWHEALVLWSDCGPHFRCKVSLSTLSANLAWSLKLHATWNFWVEMHGKSIVDGYFGLLASTAKTISMQRDLCTVDDLVGAYREGAQLRQEQEGGPGARTPETFLVHDPPEKERVPTSRYAESTWRSTSACKGCYSWHTQILDSRRETPFGKGANSKVLTAIDFKAMLMTNLKGASHRTVHPSMAEESEPTPDPDLDGDEDEPAEETLGMKTSLWRGWRTSYRMKEAEKVDVPATVRRLRSKQASTIEGLAKIPMASRHRTSAELETAAQASSSAASARAKRVKVTLAAKAAA
jgi:hypothetical protein